ncbi:MAG: GNAT family N-acetyltransferase [Desulfobacteraceae bacterium]|nr:GNAT family N-acetyltransferase [Desulfobacteraceae bacterium]
MNFTSDIRKQIYTKRLKLRLFTKNDIDIIFKLNSIPEVIKYAEKKPVETLDEAYKSLKEGQLADYKKYGYGRFAVELKSTKKVIGFCGIKFLPEYNLNDIGYRFLPEYWGKGFATESAKECIDFAKNDLKLPEIIALIEQSHQSSIRIAEKLGMKKTAVIDYEGFKACQYYLTLWGSGYNCTLG